MEQALALYAVLKGHARTDGSLRGSIQRLAPLVNTRKHPHRSRKPAANPAASEANGAAATTARA